MIPPLTRFQTSLRDALGKLLEARGLASAQTREKVAGPDEETGLPGERTLVTSFPMGRGTCEVWIYEDEVGVDAPGEEWMSFDGLDYPDESSIERAVLACVKQLFND